MNNQTIQTISQIHQALRAFEHSESTFVRSLGIEPCQYRLLLAVHSLSEAAAPTLTKISQALFLKHHSTVELVNRAVAAGLVVRKQSAEDRRAVQILITDLGKGLIAKSADFHGVQVEQEVPRLIDLLTSLASRASSGAAA